MTDPITHARIDEGFTEMNARPDDGPFTLKDLHRAQLAELLGEDIPARPTKAEFLDLLTRARAALPVGAP